MTAGRVMAATMTVGAVAACAVVAISMARAASDPQPRNLADSPLATYSATGSLPGYRVLTVAPRSTQPTTRTSNASTTAAAPSTSSAPSAAPSASAPASPSTSVRPRAATSPPTSSSPPAPKPSPSRAHPTTAPKPPPEPRGSALPLGFSTGSATRVITVVARSYGSTTATLQAWNKAPGGGWFRYGPAIYAHVGSQGLTTSPSEFKSATPIGSFTLTQGFGRYSDPGTALPYFQTTPADWWISQSGPLYNTHQRCWSGCSFTQGSPNEHLYYETPYYNYAVVINTPSGASAYPHGSAFFLHVTDGGPTAGCVAIPQSNLVPILRWLTPSAGPRILIGVT